MVDVGPLEEVRFTFLAQCNEGLLREPGAQYHEGDPGLGGLLDLLHNVLVIIAVLLLVVHLAGRWGVDPRHLLYPELARDGDHCLIVLQGHEKYPRLPGVLHRPLDPIQNGW